MVSWLVGGWLVVGWVGGWQCHVVVVCGMAILSHGGSGSVGGMTAMSLVAMGGDAISRVVQLSIVDNIG